MKIVRAIRQGRILPSKPKSSDPQQFYAIWSEPPSNHPPPLPAPKPRLPTNAESYNPPEEYLPSKEEIEKWKATDSEDRERDYLPQKFPSLRLVPAYDRFINDRFNRLLDLYLAPRIHRPKHSHPKTPESQQLKTIPELQIFNA